MKSPLNGTCMLAGINHSKESSASHRDMIEKAMPNKGSQLILIMIILFTFPEQTSSHLNPFVSKMNRKKWSLSRFPRHRRNNCANSSISDRFISWV
jgi:hypothetical protein